MEVVVKNLVKRYGGYKAVDNISFRVNKGEVLGFLGPNGAGKTTTLKILTTLLPFDGGEAFIDGLNIVEHQDEVRKRIGYVSQKGGVRVSRAKGSQGYVCSVRHVEHCVHKSIG